MRRKTYLAIPLLILTWSIMPILGLQSSSKKISSYGTVTESVTISPLKVAGSKIIDVTTNFEVKLRGFSLWGNDYIYGFGDREPYAPQWVNERWMPITQEHLLQIKRWGFNVVHISLWWTSYIGFEQDQMKPGEYNEENMRRLKILIEMAGQAGLYVIPGIRVCYDPLEMPNWAGWSTHDYVVFNQSDSSGQQGLERFCKLLEWFTQEVQDEPNVLGIEPWHFPYHRQTGARDDSERVTRFNTIVAPAMISAVRNNTNKIIFLSPVQLGHYDYTNHQPYNDSNIVYNTGGYGDHNIVSRLDGPIWDYDVSKIDRPHPSAWTFREKFKVPVMAIEGPGVAQHPESTYGRPLRKDRVDLLDATLTIMDDLSGWIIWQYSGPGSRWGVLENEDPTDPASEGIVVEILKRHTP